MALCCFRCLSVATITITQVSVVIYQFSLSVSAYLPIYHPTNSSEFKLNKKLHQEEQ